MRAHTHLFTSKKKGGGGQRASTHASVHTGSRRETRLLAHTPSDPQREHQEEQDGQRHHGCSEVVPGHVGDG